ncbi:MAG: 3-methyl-2-oxobutanoate hydroxymethyltransferase [Pseudomonadota bacterium]|nr:3-methyl-2-oxobutanoate hydroxymethyltransferase [Pseudomonadota bacterium]
MKKITLQDIYLKKRNRVGIACLTAYDSSFSKYLDDCGVDIILVGDSLGMVIQGHKNTHKVDQHDIEYHTKLVSRGIKKSYLIADMPINTYNKSNQALKNATKLINECGAKMVKIETDTTNLDILNYLTKKNIPVCAHIGIKPQHIKFPHEYKKQGKTFQDKKKILDEAIFVEQAGAKLLIVECVEESLAQKISKKLSIPVIGIASGKYCDGQILVLYDLLGISFNGIPKFINKEYFKIKSIDERIKQFIQNTRSLPKE